MFGVFNKDFLLYIKHEDLSEIAHGGQCLGIFITVIYNLLFSILFIIIKVAFFFLLLFSTAWWTSFTSLGTLCFVMSGMQILVLNLKGNDEVNCFCNYF